MELYQLVMLGLTALIAIAILLQIAARHKAHERHRTMASERRLRRD